MTKAKYREAGLSGFAARILHEEFDEPTKECVKKSIESDAVRLLRLPGIGRKTFMELVVWSGCNREPIPGTWAALSTRAQGVAWRYDGLLSDPPTKEEVSKLLSGPVKIRGVGRKTIDELRLWCGMSVVGPKQRCPTCGHIIRADLGTT